MNQAIMQLRNQAISNEIDYGFVMDGLKNYASPRGKLSRLLRAGELTRVKKGLYVFGEGYRKGSISMEVLANMIYGPSYISLEWALSYYGLIPERVYTVTSVTRKRKKNYVTPIGNFSYEHCNSDIYHIGLTSYKESAYQIALIATKEKALIDELMTRRGRVTSLVELERILFDDLRIEEEDLMSFNINIVEQVLLTYSHSSIVYLLKLLQRLR